MHNAIPLCLAAALLVAEPPSAALAPNQDPELSAPEPIAVEPWMPEAGEPAGPNAAGASFEDQVMEIVNEERWANGELPPLKRASELDSSSETHSTNMGGREFFAHCDPDTGTMPWDRMVDAGYIWSAAAENIAAGYTTPEAVMAGWMASAGHRANILATGYRELGIGYFDDTGDGGNVRRDANSDCVPDSFNNGPYRHYWTQNFGRRSAVYPVVINREAYETATPLVDLYLYAPSGVLEMRFGHDGTSWTGWEPFVAAASWTLLPGNGTKSVWAQVRTSTTTYTASDTILLASPLALIFADGFESGTTLLWSSTAP